MFGQSGVDVGASASDASLPAHDAYQTGDRVSWEGACYESNRDGNVWSPTDLPSAWDAIPCTPEPEQPDQES